MLVGCFENSLSEVGKRFVGFFAAGVVLNKDRMGAVEHFKPLLIGQDPMRTEHIWQMLTRGGFFPAQRILMAAISAIDIALWDIKGKALNVPIYDLLGGRVRDKVVCYPHNGGNDTAELVESCQQSVDEGWKFVRWGLPSAGRSSR